MQSQLWWRYEPEDSISMEKKSSRIFVHENITYSMFSSVTYVTQFGIHEKKDDQTSKGLHERWADTCVCILWSIATNSGNTPFSVYNISS